MGPVVLGVTRESSTSNGREAPSQVHGDRSAARETVTRAARLQNGAGTARRWQMPRMVPRLSVEWRGTGAWAPLAGVTQMSCWPPW
jgi:hypothetical protein